MKKRLLSVLLAAAMVATMLAGCSSKTEPEQPANTETEAPAETGEADAQAPAGETKERMNVWKYTIWNVPAGTGGITR